jgi:hypothetical protein
VTGSKRFFVATGIGAGAFAVVWAALIAPTRSAAREEETRLENAAARREAFFREKGVPLEEAFEAIEEESKTLEGLKGDVGKVELSLPAELEPTDEHLNLNYYQTKRSELTKRATSGRMTFASEESPLGLPLRPPEEELADYLARIEVTRRFVEAAERAGVAAVLRAEHPPPRVAAAVSTSGAGQDPGPSGAGGRAAEELPIVPTVSADEKSLLALLHEVSQPERFLALRGIEIEVKDAASGHFEATLDLAGVRIVESREVTPGLHTPPREPDEKGPTKPVRRRRVY